MNDNIIITQAPSDGQSQGREWRSPQLQERVEQFAYNPASNSPTTQQAIHLQLGEQFTYNSVSGNGVSYG